jgi:hypothetical protein
MPETNHTHAVPCLPQGTKYSSKVYTKVDNSVAVSVTTILLFQRAATGQVNDSEHSWQLSDTVMPTCGGCNQLTVHICIRTHVFWDVTPCQLVQRSPAFWRIFTDKHSSWTSWLFIWRHYTLWNIGNFILQSVLRQVSSLFQSEFSTVCDLVLPLSISSIFSVP